MPCSPTQDGSHHQPWLGDAPPRPHGGDTTAHRPSLVPFKFQHVVSSRMDSIWLHDLDDIWSKNRSLVGWWFHSLKNQANVGKYTIHAWLVVSGHPSETYEFVNWDDDDSQYFWENKIDVPNHQPDMGVPHFCWMVFVRENPNLKWMMTGGTPISGNPHIRIYKRYIEYYHCQLGKQGTSKWHMR